MTAYELAYCLFNRCSGDFDFLYPDDKKQAVKALQANIATLKQDRSFAPLLDTLETIAESEEF